MSTWGNADLLIEMLQRQFQFLQVQGTERRVLLLGRWLGFLQREPQLAGLVAELLRETKVALSDLTRADHDVRARLGALWAAHESLLRSAPGGLLYVEAKQYGDDVARAKIVAAYRQVWSTWGRLANVHSVSEAFLLVFRVGGPRAELPPLLRHAGRSLYSVLVDVSELAGSKEKTTPLSFAAVELLPGEANATP